MSWDKRDFVETVTAQHFVVVCDNCGRWEKRAGGRDRNGGLPDGWIQVYETVSPTDCVHEFDSLACVKAWAEKQGVARMASSQKDEGR